MGSAFDERFSSFTLTIDGSMANNMDTSAEMEPVAPIEDWNIDPSAIQLGELIGEGSFGKVYKAKYLGIDVAVKKILESVEQAQEFEHEVAVLKYVSRMMTVLCAISNSLPFRLCIECWCLGSGVIW